MAISAGLSLEQAQTLVEVARCESELRHFNKETGDVLRGKVNPLDTGILQINKKYHLDKAVEMGLDLENKVDNINYGIWLFKKEGTKPWSWSKPCHNK